MLCTRGVHDNFCQDCSAVPSAIAQNTSLLAVLLNQIILQTLKDLNVPEFPREPLVFFDPYNGWIKKYENKKYDFINFLEDETGVNLIHYRTALAYLGKYKPTSHENVNSLPSSST